MEELFSRFFSNLADRVGGPMTFRIILQPLMATLLAIKAGLRDAREGRPPYFWSLVHDPTQRMELLREGWKSVARVFVLAIVMDVIYQLIVEHWIYPGETLIVAFALAVIPYVVLRGIITRIARRFRRSPEVTANRP